MTAAEWLAVAATIGTACGGAITLAARMILGAANAMVRGQKEQTDAILSGQKESSALQRETTAAIAEMKTELVSLRTHVDTLIGVNRRSADELTPIPKISGRNGR